ncbi:hypothetical protein HK405_003758 [Cladochytrium tenue]|nr:hypothetical protein HK405_003758 [Cladochytrium tenue]
MSRARNMTADSGMSAASSSSAALGMGIGGNTNLQTIEEFDPIQDDGDSGVNSSLGGGSGVGGSGAARLPGGGSANGRFGAGVGPTGLAGVPLPSSPNQSYYVNRPSKDPATDPSTNHGVLFMKSHFERLDTAINWTAANHQIIPHLPLKKIEAGSLETAKKQLLYRTFPVLAPKNDGTRRVRRVNPIIVDNPDILVDLAFNIRKLSKLYPIQWKTGVDKEKKKEKIMTKLGRMEHIDSEQFIRVTRLAAANIPVKLKRSYFEDVVSSPKSPDMVLSDTVDPSVGGKTRVEVLHEFFAHKNEKTNALRSYADLLVIEYYVNFTDQQIFKFADTERFASEEMTAFTHPTLISLRDCLEDLASNVLGEKTMASTINVYGKAFLETPYTDFETKVIEPLPLELKDTRNNFIAMSAPDRLANPLRPNTGPYTLFQLRQIFRTAYTALRGAAYLARRTFFYHKAYEALPRDSAAEVPVYKDVEIVVHTGDWGCGEFGGNPVVMAFLQIAAAHAVGVNVLIYHTRMKHRVVVDRATGRVEDRMGGHVQLAEEYLRECWNGKEVSTEGLLLHLESKKLEWVVPGKPTPQPKKAASGAASARMPEVHGPLRPVDIKSSM